MPLFSSLLRRDTITTGMTGMNRHGVLLVQQIDAANTAADTFDIRAKCNQLPLNTQFCLLILHCPTLLTIFLYHSLSGAGAHN